MKTTKQYSEQARESVFLLLAASVASLFIYSIHFFSTALTWPAIDNLPAVCRMLDSTCLSSDFFTNASSELNPRLPYIYLLSILTDASGNGFPFSQSSFMEYEKRKALLYGNNDAIMKMSGSWIGEKYANFYRSLTPSSFVNISEEYQLNLVVVDAKYSEAFRGCNAEYISNKYKVFDMASLRQCVNKWIP